jgi:transposase-like protein
MKEHTTLQEMSKAEGQWSELEVIAREGAMMLIKRALEIEIEEYIQSKATLKGPDGKRLVVRNGHMPRREIVTGIGPLTIRQPRVDDRKLQETNSEESFTSKILPRYLRRVPSINNLIPTLYLKGISTGGFSNALTSILGDGVKGLSETNIVRLKAFWEDEYKKWNARDLHGREYVYIWADGIHCNVRLEDDKTCILVIIGADKYGKKELLAVSDGYSESALGWKEILLDLARRGLSIAPKLAIGDGALGFWAALSEVYPGTRRQRCWVHKTANILDKLPKHLQPKAKSMIHEIYLADTRATALAAYKHFVDVFHEKYPKAVECLLKDDDDLFSFFDFPAIHWIHIRTTNVIESTYATVRLRTKRTKGCGSRLATLTMVFKLAQEAEKTWHKLKGYKMLTFVSEGKKFIDGNLNDDKVA